MGLNDTPAASRVHIGFFGKRNVGKSSLVNAFTGQELCVVSDYKGTTTDPVKKAMELLPLGPVMIIDTPGIDDEGDLGRLRIQKAKQILSQTDAAVLVIDGCVGLQDTDNELLEFFKSKNIPYVIAVNKCDLCPEYTPKENEVPVSAKTASGIERLKNTVAALIKQETYRPIIGDKLSPGETAVLVVPIDSAAPKGRLILPQQQTIRDILEAGAIASVVREKELEDYLSSLSSPPKMVITDSQVFSYVAKIVPENVPLTSFSILMARYKGFLDTAVSGAAAINSLKDGDRVLISEGCTHHRQCGDIGTEKLPRLLKKYTDKSLELCFSSGTEFPEDLSGFSLVIHCGGCMLNQREMLSRMERTVSAGVPFTNYGTAIALMNGILARSIELFPHLAAKIN